MMRNSAVILLSAVLFLGYSSGVRADDNKFDSRGLLLDTLQQSLLIDRDPLLTEDEINQYNQEFEDYVSSEDLTDDQVVYLNRKFNNARHNGLQIDFTDKDNWNLMLNVIVEEYNFHQVNFLTKALESEAKFLSKYEETGNEKFMIKAATEKEKFLSRIDRFEDGGSLVPTPLPKDANRVALLLARQEARSALKDMARQARLQAKTLAKETTRSNSRGFSRNASKQLAQEVRRELKSAGRPSKGNKGKNK